ncbi:17132_t:CDS:1, partial [Funneliformis geosporum]
QYKKHEEAQSESSEEELIKEREKLQELISNLILKTYLIVMKQ